MLDPAANDLRLEVVEDENRLAQLAGPWERLAAAEPTPFCSHAWFAAWWAAFGEHSRLAVLALWDGKKLAAIYPLQARAARYTPPARPAQYAPLANVHSPLFRPLACDAAALQAATAAALDVSRGRLAVEPLPSGDLALTELERVAAKEGMRTLRLRRHVSPIVDTSGDFAHWRVGSRPRWGAPLERFRRKMLREQDATIRAVVEPDDLDGELSRGFAVEASGWKGQGGTAILSSANTERFYREVAHAAAACGELRFSTITFAGEVVAFDLTLLRSGRLYLLKTGFDERHRRLAPGLVLRLSVIERCFELGLVAHELLGDDSEWKRKFSTSDRAHVCVEVYPKRLLPLAEYAWQGTARPALARARRAVRRLVKRDG